jgi:hypothetical protein
MKELEREMNKAARAKDFEQASVYRNKLFALRELNRQSLFGDSEVLDASRDQALVGLSYPAWNEDSAKKGRGIRYKPYAGHRYGCEHGCIYEWHTG